MRPCRPQPPLELADPHLHDVVVSLHAFGEEGNAILAVFFVYKKEVRSGRSEKPRKSAAEARRMRRAADHTPSTLQLGTAEMARVVAPAEPSPPTCGTTRTTARQPHLSRSRCVRWNSYHWSHHASTHRGRIASGPVGRCGARKNRDAADRGKPDIRQFRGLLGDHPDNAESGASDRRVGFVRCRAAESRRATAASAGQCQSHHLQSLRQCDNWSGTELIQPPSTTVEFEGQAATFLCGSLRW